MSKNTFGIGLTIGALTGLAAAYLLAPKTGKEFRKDSKRKTLLTVDDAVNQTEGWLDEQIKNQRAKTREYAAETSHRAPVRDDYDRIVVEPEAQVVIKNKEL